jgi:hypothetical protein
VEVSNGKDNGAPPPSEPTNKLFVGGLAWEVTSKVLGETFEQYGEVEEARIVMDRENPTKSKGFGFVTMSSPEAAVAAQAKLNGQEIGGRAVKVDFDYGDKKPPKRFEDARGGKGKGGGGYFSGYRDDYRDGGKGKGMSDYRDHGPPRYDDRYGRGGGGGGYGRPDYYREEPRYDRGGGYGQRPMGREDMGGGGGYGDPREPPAYDYNRGGKGFGKGYGDAPPRRDVYPQGDYRDDYGGGRGGGGRDRYEGGGGGYQGGGGYPARDEKRRYDDRPRY